MVAQDYLLVYQKNTSEEIMWNVACENRNLTLDSSSLVAKNLEARCGGPCYLMMVLLEYFTRVNKLA